jgi:hypothetical protein
MVCVRFPPSAFAKASGSWSGERTVTRTVGRLVLLMLIAAAAAGCTSPESTRTRGGGPGADRGNRPAAVKMHEGSDPFAKTPVRIGKAHPRLDPARHAKQFDQR